MLNNIIDDGVWVVIPAYNEGAKIAEVVNTVKARLKNIIVVNDGSTDDTESVLLTLNGISSILHPINLGQGAALQTGISYALRQRAKWIITFDADGQHDIDDGIKMLTKAREENLDICFGSRFLGQAIGMPQSRRVLLKCALLFQTITTGMHMTDVHNGLRVISGTAALKLHIRHDRMAHASEFIGVCKTLNFKYEEFPVTIRYSSYSKSKGQGTLGALAILTDLLMAKLGK